jgi:hypothetical protein
LVANKAAEALKKSAEDTRKKISAALESGKSFDDAAKDAGIVEANLKVFSKVKNSPRPNESNEPKQLFQQISNVDPGKLAEIITEQNRAFIVHVSSREVEKDPKVGDALKTQVESTAAQNESLAYTGWLKERTASAKVESLIKR